MTIPYDIVPDIYLPPGFIVLHNANNQRLYIRASTIHSFGAYWYQPDQERLEKTWIGISKRYEIGVIESVQEVAKIISMSDEHRYHRIMQEEGR